MSRIRACCQNFFQRFTRESIVINLLASSGYLLQFLERAFWIVTYSSLGNLGKGNLAAGILGLSLYHVGFLIVDGILSSQSLFLMRQKSSELYWLQITGLLIFLLTTFLACIIFILCMFILSYFGVSNEVVFKTKMFSLLISPILFLHGINRMLLYYCEYLNATRLLIFSHTLRLIAMLTACLLLNFVLPFGLYGTAIAADIAYALEILVLAFYLREQFHFVTFIKDVYKKLRKIFRKDKKKERRQVEDDEDDEREEHMLLGNNAINNDNVEIELPQITSNKIASKKKRKTKLKHIDNEDVERNIPMKLSEEIEEKADIDDDIKEDDVPLVSHDADEKLHEIDNKSTWRSIFGRLQTMPILAEVLRIFIMGMPAALMLIVDAAPYEVTSLMITSLGTISIGVNQMLFLLIQFVGLSICLPLSLATTIRIRALFKANTPKEAGYTVTVSLIQTALMSTVLSIAFYFARDYLWYWFTHNTDLTSRAANMCIFGVCFSFAYNVHICTHGILRAIGKQYEAMWLSLVAIWIVGIPTSILLTYGWFLVPQRNLEGLWIGLITGIGLLAFTQCIYIGFVDWEKEHRRMIFRRDRLQMETFGAASDLVLFGDAAVVCVAARAIGSFETRTKTLQEEMDELELLELNDESEDRIEKEETTRRSERVVTMPRNVKDVNWRYK